MPPTLGVWIKRVLGIDPMILSLSKIVGDTAYIFTEADHLFAIDLQIPPHKHERWKQDASYRGRIMTTKEHVCFLDDEQHFRCVKSKTGELEWVSPCPSRDQDKAFIIKDRIVFWDQKGEQLYSFDLNTGQKNWQLNIEDSGGGLYTQVAFNDTTLVFSPAVYNGKTYIIDLSTGRERWSGDVGRIEAALVGKDSVLFYDAASLKLFDIQSQKFNWVFNKGANDLG